MNKNDFASSLNGQKERKTLPRIRKYLSLFLWFKGLTEIKYSKHRLGKIKQQLCVIDHGIISKLVVYKTVKAVVGLARL